MSKRWVTILWAVVALAAIAALALTVFNKAWWTRRIDKRWVVWDVVPAAADAPPGFDKPTFNKIAFDDAQARKYGLGELMRLYFTGAENWTRA